MEISAIEALAGPALFVAALIGFGQVLKMFGVKGRVVAVVNMVLGAALLVANEAIAVMPAFAPFYQAFVKGLVLGLASAGIFAGSRLAGKVFGGVSK